MNALDASAPTRALSEVPVTALRGVGPRVAGRLAALGIHSVQDLLFHLPARYQDRTRIAAIGALRPGDEAVVVAEVQLAQVRYARRRSLLALVADGTGRLTLRFFHFTPQQQSALARGVRVQCFGEVRRGPQGLEMVHPEYRVLGPQESAGAEDRLTPVYPATEGVSQATIRRLTALALDRLGPGPGLEDHLPAPIADRLGLPALADAVRGVHRPAPGAERSPAEQLPERRRLAFEELLAHHLSLRLMRRRLEVRAAPALRAGGELARRFREGLPFALTDAQARVLAELGADLEREHPMHRLVQGDVGSGKTVVAALAALQAIECGHQTALMAPTELLAEQHYLSFERWLAPLDVSVAWLSGRLSGRQRAAMGALIATGEAKMVVGTHALFQDDVRFDRLGLVIIDEQHRFGVHQRLALRSKGGEAEGLPHQLIMTATPIPRTLAMTAYADLDVSVIDALPPGRQPVETAVVPATRRAEVVQRVRNACRAGEQAYWVCTLVEDSEALQGQAAAETHRVLSEALPELRIGLVHGRMKPAEKEAAMAAFKAGSVDLLVATTVIEVGVDVPNASLMIIENAERLGLAQLHQLRGRVGRGSRRSVCLMMYEKPLSPSARARLEVLRDTHDGFVIAQRDLEIRGPGEVLGTRQTGLAQFRVADLAAHGDLLPLVQRAATEILDRHPGAVAPLVRRWVGDRLDYAVV